MPSRSYYYSGTFIMVIIAKSGGLSLAILSARCILVSCQMMMTNANKGVILPQTELFLQTHFPLGSE